MRLKGRFLVILGMIVMGLCLIRVFAVANAWSAGDVEVYSSMESETASNGAGGLSDSDEDSIETDNAEDQYGRSAEVRFSRPEEAVDRLATDDERDLVPGVQRLWSASSTAISVPRRMGRGIATENLPQSGVPLREPEWAVGGVQVPGDGPSSLPSIAVTTVKPSSAGPSPTAGAKAIARELASATATLKPTAIEPPAVAESPHAGIAPKMTASPPTASSPTASGPTTSPSTTPTPMTSSLPSDSQIAAGLPANHSAVSVAPVVNPPAHLAAPSAPMEMQLQQGPEVQSQSQYGLRAELPLSRRMDEPIPGSAASRVGVQEVGLIVSEKGFLPERIFVTQNIPVRLYLSTPSKNTLCFLLDAWSVKKGVAPGRVEEVTFIPEAAGNYRFYCPVKSIEGTLVVREAAVAEQSARGIASQEGLWSQSPRPLKPSASYRYNEPKNAAQLRALIED